MRVALIGAELEENLAVRYLWGALEAAGHEVVSIVFNAADEGERAARELATSGADLAGLSMVFTYRAREFAALARRARALGYTGHVIAGGHFAAFHARELLRDVAAIDSVAIGEGEHILCDLARVLETRSAAALELDAVRGLVWRAPDGEVRANAPAEKVPDLDTLPVPPRKQPFDHYFGLSITNMLGSRGCAYSCSFCSIVAWHRLCGGERVRMRSIASVADELAALYAAGARIFNFHDDNFFLRDKAAMLVRVAELGRALAERGVGRIAFAVKARPDAVDAEVFEALRALGLFRVFLGIEAGSETALRALGRRQTVAQNEQALAVTARLDIHTAFNLLLWNPDSTLEDLAVNVAFLRRHPHNPTNFCRTEIYTGTPLEKKLARERRLTGDYWGYSYEIADARAELAYQIAYAAFETRNYGADCLHHLCMAVDYQHQLLGHFFETNPELRRRVKRFVTEVNLDTATHLEAVIAACGRGFDTAEARTRFEATLGARVAAGNRRFGAEGQALLDEMRALAANKSDGRSRGLRRTARAVTIAAGLTLAAAGSAGCGDGTHATEAIAPPPTAPPNPPPTHASEMAPAPPDAGAPVDAGAGPSDGGATHAGPSDAGAARDASAPPPSGTAGKVPDAGPRPPHTTHHTEMLAPRMK